jgi:hypothetical protein
MAGNWRSNPLDFVREEGLEFTTEGKLTAKTIEDTSAARWYPWAQS